MPSRSLAEHLLWRLASELGLDIPDGTTIRRTYAGRVQRQAGAWSWFALGPDGREFFGSHYPVTNLLKEKALAATFDEDTGFVCIDPAAPGRPTSRPT